MASRAAEVRHCAERAVIFLFIMTAFAETLDKKWTQAGLPRIEAEYTPISASSNAQQTGHIKPARTSASTTQLSQVLFLDDSGFPFNSREDAATGTRIVKETFTELGLEMHCGSDENKKSKTEKYYGYQRRPSTLARRTNYQHRTHYQLLRTTPKHPTTTLCT